MDKINESVISLILGGGAGSRLYPLTAERSKPAVPFAGKHRLIDVPISNCLNSSLRRIFVLTQFNSASLNRHIKRAYHFDSFSDSFVDIQAAEQTLQSHDWFQGTADAVRQTLPRLEDYDFDCVLVLSGDQLYQMDLRKFIQTHLDLQSDITVATIPVIHEHATGFGIMKVDEKRAISDFIEKPSSDELADWTSEVGEHYKTQHRHYLASMGIYLFKRDVLLNVLKRAPEANDFGKEIIPLSIKNGFRVSSHLYDGYWTDIGTIKSFFKASLELCDPLPQFNFFDNENPVFTRARMLSPTKILGTYCERALLAEGCIIHAARLYRVVIGIRSRIGNNSVMNEVYMMGQDSYEDISQLNQGDRVPMGVGPNCVIERAILDRNCRIGHDVHIIGADHLEDTENELFCIRDGIIVVRKGAVIPPGSRIGAA